MGVFNDLELETFLGVSHPGTGGPCDKVLEKRKYSSRNPFDDLEDNPNGFVIKHNSEKGGFEFIFPEKCLIDYKKIFYENYVYFRR